MPRSLPAASLLLLVPFFAGGCATLDESYRKNVCQADAAFAAGVNDAMDGKRMEPAYGGGCAEAELAVIRAAYRDGFLAGADRRRLEGRARGWTCEVRAFTERYAAAGETEAEAAARVRRACEAKYDPMHCDDVTCRPGR